MRCFGSENDYYSSDRKAQEHAAERKRRRVQENMANAQEANAVDVDDTIEEEKRRRLEEEEAARQGIIRFFHRRNWNYSVSKTIITII